MSPGKYEKSQTSVSPLTLYYQCINNGYLKKSHVIKKVLNKEHLSLDQLKFLTKKT